MPLIGLASTSIVLSILFVRVTARINKAVVLGIWAITAAHSFGVRL